MRWTGVTKHSGFFKWGREMWKTTKTTEIKHVQRHTLLYTHRYLQKGHNVQGCKCTVNTHKGLHSTAHVYSAHVQTYYIQRQCLHSYMYLIMHHHIHIRHTFSHIPPQSTCEYLNINIQRKYTFQHMDVDTPTLWTHIHEWMYTNTAELNQGNIMLCYQIHYAKTWTHYTDT